MDFKVALFYFFASILVVAAIAVVVARNPVHSALNLVLAFFSAAAIWLLLRAEFLAIVLVLVYVGAVMVLFLFVVMMLDIHNAKLRDDLWRHLPLAATVGVLIALEMAAVLFHSFWAPDLSLPASTAQIGTARHLGQFLYTQYLYPFMIAGELLLLAMVAAVALTLRHRKDRKWIDPAIAVKIKPGARVRLVQMPTVFDAPPPKNKTA